MMLICKKSEFMLCQICLQMTMKMTNKQLLKCLFSEWSLDQSGLSRIVDSTFKWYSSSWTQEEHLMVAVQEMAPEQCCTKRCFEEVLSSNCKCSSETDFCFPYCPFHRRNLSCVIWSVAVVAVCLRRMLRNWLYWVKLKEKVSVEVIRKRGI